MNFNEERKIFKSVSGKTKTKLDYTLFDRDFLISLSSKVSEMEQLTHIQIGHIKELEKRIAELEEVRK